MLHALMSRTAPAAWADYAPLVLRVVLGIIFFMHGYAKITMMGVDKVSGMLAGIGFPAPALFAYILMYGETIGGMLLIVGVLTYWVSLFNIVVAFVAGFFVHLSKGFFINEGGYEFILLIGAASVALFITGPGKYSVDAHLQTSDTSQM